MRLPSFGAHFALLNPGASVGRRQWYNPRYSAGVTVFASHMAVVSAAEGEEVLWPLYFPNEHDDELLSIYLEESSQVEKRSKEWSCTFSLPRGGSSSESEALPSELASTVLEAAIRKAVSGGLTGSIAGILQVFMFMWLRTVMNYQYRHGGDGFSVFHKLWNEGGIRRLYRGLPFAIVQGPMARFGSAASNTLVMALHNSNVAGLGALPIFLVTMMGSFLTAMYRAALMPIDTLKIVSQVEGRQGFQAVLKAAFFQGKIYLLYTGAYAMAAATLIGHFPWFVTFNLLDKNIPKPLLNDDHAARALRAAFIGFSSSLVSDLVSNPIRVIKTTKQSTAAAAAISSSQEKTQALRAVKSSRLDSSPHTSGQIDSVAQNSSYSSIISHIVRTDGVSAFFTRGLSTRILVNGLQSMVFTVVWRFLLGE